MTTKTVYALYWPETRTVVQDLWASFPHHWYEEAYTKIQDNMHEPFLDGWRQWSGIGLGNAFPHAYPTNGASEGIKEFLLPPGKLHVFDGEYEGYGAIARERKMEAVSHHRSLDAARARFGKDDQFWISQPSSVDGNIWPDLDAFLDEMHRRHPQVRVFLDFTYVGATVKPVHLEVWRHPNVAAVIFSLSKPFGVYYHRVGGCYSRERVGTLWGNLWFKNLFSVNLGYHLMASYARCELPMRYAPVQRAALDQAISRAFVPQSARPSDVILLAHDTHGNEEYRRTAEHFRFCLTPHIDAIITNGA